MANFTCTSCHRTLNTLAHWSEGECKECYEKNTGDTVHAVDDGVDHDRLAEDINRLNAEQQKEFDLREALLAERAERVLARRRLLPFILRCNPDYVPGWVHADICEKLEQFSRDVEEGKSPRLMINMPPRHGKSEIASKTFPSWHLGRLPKHEVITCSYSGDLAKDFSRKCRDLISSEEYRQVFPKTVLSKESKSVEKWSTTKGGGFTAAGVQGPITGRGAHVGIIDDPVKDREEAESPGNRQKVKDWYSSTFYTRLAPGGGVLVIQTRWHEDDLSGWLLDVMKEAEQEMLDSEDGEWPEDADRWEVVQYPAVALEDEQFRKQGEALHEDRYPIKALNKIKRAMLPRDWEALYQQRPTSDDGDYFTKDMFSWYSIVDRPPLDEMRIYSASDLAISKATTADYSVTIVAGIDRNQNIWILDIYRGQWNSLELTDHFFDVQQTWGCEIMGIESGQIELTLEPFLMKAEEERGKSLNYEKLKTRGMDKQARARPIQGRMQQGRVHFPRVAEHRLMQWLYNEMLKFPLGKNDDGVDGMAWLGQMITLFGIVYQAEDNRRSPVAEKTVADRLREFQRMNRTGSSSAMSA